MSENYGNDPKKMLDWNKKLGEQSEYVKKAIDPLLTWKFAAFRDTMDYGGHNRTFWEEKGQEDPNYVKEEILKIFDGGNLFDWCSGDGEDEKRAVEKLKSLGIEGYRYNDKATVFDDEYLKSLNREERSDEKLVEWNEKIKDFDEDVWLNEKYVFPSRSEILKHKFDDNFVVIFGINQPSDFDGPVETTILNYISFNKELNDSLWHNDLDIKGNVYTAYDIVESAIKHFDNISQVDEDKLDSYLEKAVKIENEKFELNSLPSLAIAQKTGYVQDVCESVLAFNTDENRKIMSESTMTFLSKKLLSEMNVTKDMAQKFANPETYKALEKCVFAPQQEQHLEQTQSQGRSM